MSAKLIQGYEVVIGFETHAQLSTASKIFSRAPTAFGAEPNTQASPVDLALPGTLPVMNKGAVERAIEFGLAVNSHIAERSVFARKNYFYPDLPKGYQISQFEIPVVQGGSVEFYLGEEKKSVRLVRAHLEEDAGKSIHGEGLYGVAGTGVAGEMIAGYGPDESDYDLSKMSGIDLNRAGTPLLEIVTEPDMRSSDEAVAYAKELHKIVTWIGIRDGNMQEGSFRCDANVSVRKPGAPLGTRREIKNLNSFKFMQQAIDFEIRWQIGELEEGRPIRQATVLFNAQTGRTESMREKEDAADYRYFPDPDLPPLVVSREWVQDVRERMHELPRDMAARFVSELELDPYLAAQVTTTHERALLFEGASARNTDTEAIPASRLNDLVFRKQLARRVAVLVAGEIARKMNESEGPSWQLWIDTNSLGRIALYELDGRINAKGAKAILDALWSENLSRRSNQAASRVDELVRELGVEQMNDTGALEKIVDDVIAANADNVAQFKAGKEKAFNALVGQVMKASKGKANPAQVNDLLRAKLS